MRINIPPLRLYTAQVGDKVKLFGDGANREFVVSYIRPDRYVELTWKGYLSVTASPCSRLVK